MYFRELGLNWTSLLAASIGISVGTSLSYYTMSMFGPPMLAEFGWSKAQFALIGSLPLITLALIPFAGRFTDRFGARLSAIIGFTFVPLGFLGYTMMSGNIYEFFAIYAVQHIFGILTTSFVFARVIVERFDAARGIALSVLMTGPPLTGAVLPPILGSIMDESGWRGGFLLVAALSAAGGLFAILTMGRSRKIRGEPRDPSRFQPGELKRLLRSPIFLLVMLGMFLVNLPNTFASTQLKLALLDLGAGDNAATWMLSLYATGVIVGRFASGLALDRFPSHLVALASLSLPAIGFFTLAAAPSLELVLAGGVMVIGLAQGAEGDIGAYLVSRRFDLRNYSMLMACVTAAIAGGSAIGSLLLAFTLTRGDSYVPFLIVAAVATLVGAALFGLTGMARMRASHPPSEPERSVVDQALAGEIG
jgi:MFS family permease